MGERVDMCHLHMQTYQVLSTLPHFWDTVAMSGKDPRRVSSLLRARGPAWAGQSEPAGPVVAGWFIVLVGLARTG